MAPGPASSTWEGCGAGGLGRKSGWLGGKASTNTAGGCCSREGQQALPQTSRSNTACPLLSSTACPPAAHLRTAAAAKQLRLVGVALAAVLVPQGQEPAAEAAPQLAHTVEQPGALCAARLSGCAREGAGRLEGPGLSHAWQSCTEPNTKQMGQSPVRLWPQRSPMPLPLVVLPQTKEAEQHWAQLVIHR